MARGATPRLGGLLACACLLLCARRAPLPGCFCGPWAAAGPPLRAVAMRGMPTMGTAPDGKETLLEREARRQAAVEAEIAAEAAAPTVEADKLLNFGSSITGLLKPLLQAQAKFAAGDYDRDQVRAAIEAETRSAPVVVYTLSQSPFSIEAKRLLDESKVDYREIELAPLFFLADGENAAKRAELGAMTDRTSMPHIFINGQSIGGVYDGTPGLATLVESGELKTMDMAWFAAIQVLGFGKVQTSAPHRF
ncbi:unnamed protein product [Prorocentrum cordatum]|uniref:Glutaredoxin domain-containing protein n=1 Tax=Prorocentrum cordatum TaxID=2364126 RepID=A0ABN9PSR0_9DINO|nr:unnamed protein product [Polarella glacialis]